MRAADNGHLARIELVGPRGADGIAGTSFMDYHLFCRLADALPELSELRLQGRGEPLSHLHLFDMVRYAVSRGLLVSLTTGLGVLSEQQAEECVTSGLYRIRIAADAAALRQAANPAFHPPSHPRFFRILRNLRRLTAARTRLQRLRPEVSLLAVIEQRDLPHLSQLVRFAGDEGIEKLAIGISDSRNALAPALATRKLLREAESLARQIGVALEPLRFLRDRAADARASFTAFNGDIVHAEPALPARPADRPRPGLPLSGDAPGLNRMATGRAS